MKNQFNIILPSNSGAMHFSDNTASRYTTLLPREIQLHGEWSVALTEIQFPCNFLHIRDKDEGCLSFMNMTFENDLRQPETYYIPRGIYASINELVNALNKIQILSQHVLFKFDIDGFITIKRICTRANCTVPIHFLRISSKLKAILGFDPDSEGDEGYGFFESGRNVANHPPSLSRALPNNLFVYCDICEPYITGDAQTPLLRIVPFDSSDYKYGANRTVSFAMPNYISLLHTTFRTIEIDIRDSLGNLLPFEYGPLNVTLHFKRDD